MSLIDEIKIKSLSDAQEILKAAGTEDILDFEKAHKDGDLHPNGKWVWVSSANGGKGDWRTLNGRTHKKHQAANAAGGGSSSASSTTTGGNTSSVKTTISDGGKKKMINAKTNVKVVPDTYTIRGNRSSRKMDALYKEMDEKYKDYSREDLQKLKDSFDKKRTIALAIDRYKQLTKQGASKIAINKEGNLCDELTARYYTINRLLATEDVTNDVDNSKTTSSKSKKSSVKVDIDTIDQDEYNRMYKQAKSVDKQGRSMALSIITSNINTIKKNLEETISNRPGAKVTIKKLQDNLTKFLSQKKAVEDVVGEIDNSKSNKTSKTETYSHDINGVSVNVSKNKDGSYTLEANGKKVKSDDPSFFKDKLLPRVKKALAKELGIESTAKKTSTKKTTNGNSLKSKLDDIKRAISKNGYTANVSTDGSIVIYEKGARKTAENVKGRIKSFDDIDWGNKKGVQAKLESAIKAALSNDTQKSTKVQTFEAQNAAAYDKGNGKIGNYAKPETRSYRADALLRMMKNNIHLGFTYGMDGKKINEELKARGDKLVTVTMHKNGDGNDIYRVKFD